METHTKVITIVIVNVILIAGFLIYKYVVIPTEKQRTEQINEPDYIYVVEGDLIVIHKLDTGYFIKSYNSINGIKIDVRYRDKNGIWQLGSFHTWEIEIIK